MTQLAHGPETAAPRTNESRRRVAGRVTALAGLLGALSAVVIIAWPDQVSDDRYSYPFGATSYAVSQSWFAVQHVGLAVGLMALYRLARRSTGRTARAGVLITLFGMVGLTACELFAITAADDRVGSAAANAVDNTYGGPMILMGVGLVLAGVGIGRAELLPGPARWLVLAMGVYVFVVLFPAVFGPLVVGRLAIGVWMLMFSALGLALLRESGPS